MAQEIDIGVLYNTGTIKLPVDKVPPNSLMYTLDNLAHSEHSPTIFAVACALRIFEQFRKELGVKNYKLGIDPYESEIYSDMLADL